MRSAGSRFFIVGILALLMFIPLFFAGQIIDDRARYSERTQDTLGREMGGPQVLMGPELVIPVQELQEVTRQIPIKDPISDLHLRDANGELRFRVETEEKLVAKPNIHLFPRSFDADISTQTDIRKRGIFQVPVYRATADLGFDYDLDQLADVVGSKETILWDQAQIVMALGSTRALRGEVTLAAGDREFSLDPWAGDSLRGVSSKIGDPRKQSTYAFSLGFQGAETLQIAPVGRTTRVNLQSDWPHPSFNGAFLPDQSDISADGFSAKWSVPHLARGVKEIGRSSLLGQIQREAFGFRFFQPNDFYQKAYRAARYGILFIGLTFLTVLLIEGAKTTAGSRPTHPVQYILIGLVQSMFVVLMVAYAEQIGFNSAYLLASCAVVALLTFYAWVGLKLGQRSLVLGAMLATLYAVLFMILRSADFALVAGATLVFAALAGTMWATRNEEWYGPEGPSTGLWARARKSLEPAKPEID